MNMKKTIVAGLFVFICASIAPAAQAVFIGNTQGGTDFPQGAASFADVVTSYSPGMVGSNPTEPNRGSGNALGIPDYNGSNTCANQAECPYVSLGDGGIIVLQFTDNKLTASGNTNLDLWIFEVGPDVEDTFVEISVNGIDWIDAGKVFGTTAGIDIDAITGVLLTDQFEFVRLTDDPNEGGQNGATVGADIDAVGAISTILTPVRAPEPATLALLGLGLAGIGFSRRKAA